MSPTSVKKPVTIAICGLQGSGKDTIVKMFFKYITTKKTDWRIVDTSRMICAMYANSKKVDYNFVRENKYKLRKELQTYGDANRSLIKKNIENAITAWRDAGKNVILNSARTQAEYDIIKKLDQWFFLIEADRKARKKRVALSGENHHTENAIIPLLMDEKNHFRINNSGDLESTLKRLKEVAYLMGLS